MNSTNREKGVTKLIKMVLVIIFVFILCWTPLFGILTITKLDSSISINQNIFQFISWLPYLSSALNPFIYSIFSLRFQQNIQKIFKTIRNRRQSYSFQQNIQVPYYTTVKVTTCFSAATNQIRTTRWKETNFNNSFSK